MHVSQISLTDFRSYAHLELDLSPGASAFVGPNGQGKTNLVEAIAYAATLTSHRVSSETALVRAGSPRAVVRVRAVRGDRQTLVELEINPGRANRAQVNRSPVRRTRDVLGILRTVVFAPEDLAVVKGDPDGRRRFLDELTIQVAPRMAGVLADYDRVLRQRGALLKSAGPGTRRHVRGAAGRGGAGRGDAGQGGAGRGAIGDATDVPGDGGPESAELSTLDVWDAKLAQIGAEVLAARVRLVEQLRPHVALAYSQVSDGGEATLGYRSSLHRRSAEDPSPWPSVPAEEGANELTEVPHSGVGADVLEGQLLEALGRARRQELERGVNLVGPHRDDLVLGLGGLPAKGYASHGESWSFALALRLASYQLLTHGDDGAIGGWAAGSEPVLVLDDVFAELDSERRGRLAHLVGEAEQVLVTAAVLQDVPAELLGARYDVIGGTVSRGR